MGIHSSGVSLGKKDIFRLIKDDLDLVEARLKTQARSSLGLVDDINQYLHESGGKRLRPAVLLLCSRLLGGSGEAVVRLAGVVELIHVATLVHDDIIDNARVRRGRPSVNARWGNQVTVLMGDWKYMTSFHIALELQNFRILDILIDITRTMVEGELLQLELNGSLDITEQQEMEICLRKTAWLFSGCGRLASIVAGVDGEVEERLAEYGRCLGLAFQLTDDLLDYTSNEQVLGKPVLKDLEEGKITLPIIYLMKRATETERQFLRSVMENRDFNPDNKRRILDLVQTHHTLEDVRALALEKSFRAIECLRHFPDSIYREALMQLPQMVVSRNK